MTAQNIISDVYKRQAYMCTDMDKMEAVLDDPYILITDKKISNIQDILPLLEKSGQAGSRLRIRSLIHI